MSEVSLENDAVPSAKPVIATLTTFQRKIDDFGIVVEDSRQCKPRRHDRRGGQRTWRWTRAAQAGWAACFSMARPILTMLSA
jgi:hypothetical protein